MTNAPPDRVIKLLEEVAQGNTRLLLAVIVLGVIAMTVAVIQALITRRIQHVFDRDLEVVKTRMKEGLEQQSMLYRRAEANQQHAMRILEPAHVDLRLRRIDAYRALWSLTAILAPRPRKDISYADLVRLRQEMRTWYFDGSGLFLSRSSTRYYRLLVDGLEVFLPEDPRGKVDVDEYDEIATLCSQLRTSLTLDVRSRAEASIDPIHVAEPVEWDNRPAMIGANSPVEAAEAAADRERKQDDAERAWRRRRGSLLERLEIIDWSKIDWSKPMKEWAGGIGTDGWMVRQIITLHLAPSGTIKGDRDEHRTVCAQEIARTMRQTLKDEMSDQAPAGGLGAEPRAIDVRAAVICWEHHATEMTPPDRPPHGGTVD
jgi:hypothetical protein